MGDSIRTALVLNELRSLHITTPRDAEFAFHLNRLLTRDASGNLQPEAVRFTRTRESRGILVIDEPGGGKSHLVDRSLDRHPALSARDGGQPHYIDSVVPSPASMKAMALEILKRTGMPQVSRQREMWALWDMVRHRLQMLDIAVLWIDEAHDLFCADRATILRGIKRLMQGDHAVVVVLSGTPILLEIIRSDPQVQRRFSTLRLDPVSEALDGSAFAGIIVDYCRRAGLAVPQDEDLVARLVHASRRRFGRSVKTIIDAIEQALEFGDDQLEMVHFARAWALDEGCDPEDNVFLVDKWHLIDPDRKLEPDMDPRSRRRMRS